MKQSRIRKWDENNGLINFNLALIRRKKQEKLKTQGREASHKFKSKVAVIHRNVQHFSGAVL